MCEYVAAGVACVTRVVVTAPTDLPAALASSSSVTAGVPLLAGHVLSAPLT